MIKNLVALLLILITLWMPVACFAHPCAIYSEPYQSTIANTLTLADQCPMPHDLDDCDSTCCCAGYVVQPMQHTVNYNPALSSHSFIHSNPFLPMLLTRIFIPPQNEA
jgi:hypothetical protein